MNRVIFRHHPYRVLPRGVVPLRTTVACWQPTLLAMYLKQLTGFLLRFAEMGSETGQCVTTEMLNIARTMFIQAIPFYEVPAVLYDGWYGRGQFRMD